MSKTALVFGATGISGIAAIDALLQDSSYERIIGISRRPVDRQGVDHISIDLINFSDNQIADILIKGGADTSTHVFFYAYIDSQDIEEQNSVNNKLFDKVSKPFLIQITSNSRNASQFQQSAKHVQISNHSISKQAINTTCPVSQPRNFRHCHSRKTVRDKDTSLTSSTIIKKINWQ